MKQEEEKTEPIRFSPDGGRLLIAVIAISCTSVILASPQPVAPGESPPLILDQGEVERVLREDRERAAEVPETEEFLRIARVYRSAGLAELGEPEAPRAGRERTVEMAEGIRAIAEEHGEEAVIALRARMTERAVRALKGELPAEDRRGLLGTFASIMERYSVIEEGRLIAPEFVLRALYKARWNGYMRLELTSGLEDIELEAYWGWLALAAHGIEVRRRLHALDSLEEVSEEEFPEARATLLFLSGEYSQSADIFDELYHRTGSLRYRNHALAAVHAAQ